MTVIPFSPYIEYRFTSENKSKLCHKATDKIHSIWREYITEVFKIDFELTNNKQYAGMRYTYILNTPVLSVLNPKSAKILVYNRKKEEKSR